MLWPPKTSGEKKTGDNILLRMLTAKAAVSSSKSKVELRSDTVDLWAVGLL